MSIENRKLLGLFDSANLPEDYKIQGCLRGRAKIINHDTGEVIFRDNKVIISGSGLIARKLFDNIPDEVTPTYNTTLGITTPSGSETEPDFTEATETDHRILLFCIGTGGCGVENSQVYAVDYKKWIDPDHLIPFRYPLLSNDLSATLQETYTGRVESGSRAAYYFKRFDSDPVFVQQFIDGTPIDNTIFESEKADKAESYVELVLSITKDDVREWFIATTGINDAKVNQVSLCSAWVKVIDDIPYFQDIRPVTVLNFPNEPLIDITKGIDIIYHIYM